MILVLSSEENEVLRSVSDLGLSTQTLMSYLLDAFGGLQIVVQDESIPKEPNESVDEVLKVEESEQEEPEEAEA